MPGSGQKKRRLRVVLIGAAVMAVTAGGIGLLVSQVARDHRSRFARSRAPTLRATGPTARQARPSDPRRSQGRSGRAAAYGAGIGPARPRRGRHGHLSATAR